MLSIVHVNLLSYLYRDLQIFRYKYISLVKLGAIHYGCCNLLWA